MGSKEEQSLSLVVDNIIDENDQNYSPGDLSLREALQLTNRNDGPDTITFAAALTAGGPATILLTLGQLPIQDAVTITGPSATLLTVDASGNDPTPDSTLDDGNDTNDLDGSRVFNIDDADPDTRSVVVIEGLTITGGDTNSFGGGILNREDLTLTACVVTGNVADSGGGIANFDRLTVLDSTISNNQSLNSGGGINNSSYVRVLNSTISGNSARFLGGGVYNFQGQAAIELSTINNNRAEQNGTGAGGGGLANVTGGSLSPMLSVVGCQIIGNVTSGGNNSADGGGILNRFGSLTVTSSTISGNEANGRGGGVFGRGGTTIDNSTISGNAAGLDGGGILTYDYGFSLTSSTVSGNRSATSGGGVFLRTYLQYTARIEHSTITGNTADDDNDNAGSGGGVFSNGTGLLQIVHTIVAGNFDNSDTAPDLDLLTDPPLATQLRFSLVGDKSGSGLVEAQTPDADGNLIGDPNGDGVIDALLGPLADNGGPTTTHALLAGSPAINAGDPEFPAAARFRPARHRLPANKPRPDRRRSLRVYECRSDDHDADVPAANL